MIFILHISIIQSLARYGSNRQIGKTPREVLQVRHLKWHRKTCAVLGGQVGFSHDSCAHFILGKRLIEVDIDDRSAGYSADWSQASVLASRRASD
jgi:hypothetical protein